LRREPHDIRDGPGFTLYPETDQEKFPTAVEGAILQAIFEGRVGREEAKEMIDRATINNRDFDGWGGHVIFTIPSPSASSLDRPPHSEAPTGELKSPGLEPFRGDEVLLQVPWREDLIGALLLTDATDEGAIDIHPMGGDGITNEGVERLLFSHLEGIQLLPGPIS
jgi:hypothetical protein